MTSTPHRPDDPDSEPDPGPDADQDMREADTADGERPPEGARP